MRGRRGKYTGETPEISHEELVQTAFAYLRTDAGCSVVFQERVSPGFEIPDAIGFKSGLSFLIECKASRADFLADKKKAFRKNPALGMGYERYFMAPIGLLEPSEIPDGWGLLEVCEMRRKYRRVEKAKEGGQFFERGLIAEVSYLVSAIRRINVSMAVFVESEAVNNEN